MNLYEEYIALLTDQKTNDALEASCDALAFAASLHNYFVDQGVLDKDEEPNLSKLENLIDAYFGEFMVSLLYMGRIPGIKNQLLASYEELKDTEEVPFVIREGFKRLATRLDAFRKQQEQLMELAKEQNE